jgi:hypothetical protein
MRDETKYRLESNEEFDLALDFVENCVGMADFSNNWRMYKKKYDAAGAVKTWLEANHLLGEPKKVVEILEFLAMQNIRWLTPFQRPPQA